ncbi:polysaccharide deacetylase [Caloranaerobacter azorensis H53214]|uniref:Polysaccharide deacetylase n=1 Tax=Caloranaerobacter azorensis H53214 TaxID=1156417 RepID=A0A096BFP3_9FIRM|nr:polysaccharide deacetylase family protein [Caloranaerobacter azorensis]KGG79682.1 polysaccharide deacetylase [Caloranaerobacter azorensis H53214]
MSSKLYISMYHYVRDLKSSRYPRIKGLDYHLFRQQLEFFKQNFNVVTMEEVIAAYKESYELPKYALLLTFDDGYIDHYLYVLPILKEYGMQGSFFVPGKVFVENALLDVNKIHFILASSDVQVLLSSLFKKLNYYRGQEFYFPSNEELFEKYAVANRFDCKEIIFIKRILQMVLPERIRSKIASEMFEEHVGVKEENFAKELYLNYDQMKHMKREGMHFGIHGYDHYWMNMLRLDELKQDITKALICMDEFVDSNCWVINYPYGSYSDDVINYVKSMGSILGVTTDLGIVDLKTCHPFKLPRLDTNDFPPKSNTYLKFMY